MLSKLTLLAEESMASIGQGGFCEKPAPTKVKEQTYSMLRLRNSFFLMKKNGMSLIEVLVSLGVMSILAFGLLTVSIQQFNATKITSERLIKLEVERQAISILADGDVCSGELADSSFNLSAPYVINASSAAALSAVSISLTKIRTNRNPGAPSFVEVNSMASPMSRTLLIDGILVKDFSTTGDPNLFWANVIISFKNAFQPMKAIVLKQLIQTKPTDPPSAKTIVACNKTTPSPIPSFNNAYVNTIGSRNFNVTYTNSNPSPLFVTVTGSGIPNISQRYMAGMVDGVQINMVSVSDANAGMGWLAANNTLSFIVPPGKTYQVQVTPGTVNKIFWYELF